MNKTLLKIFAIIPLMFTFGVWRTEGAVTVELNPPRSGLPEGMPFFQAVPLPEGLLSMDPGQMLYSTDSGTPMKARPATYWPDGSVQWLQVSGITGKTAAEKWVNTLDFDVEFPSSEFDSVSVREVVLDGDKIRLLDGKGEPWMTLEWMASMVRVELPMRPPEVDPEKIDSEGQYRWAAPLNVLSNSPKRVDLRMNVEDLRKGSVDGLATTWIISGTGRAPEVDGRLEWQLRIEPIDGSSIVRLAMTWSAFWDEKRWALAGASLVLQPEGGFIRGRSGKTTIDSIDGGWFVSNSVTGESVSSQEAAESGEFAADWLCLGKDGEWFGIALPDFRYLGPNRLEVSKDGLEIHFWDSRSGLALDLRRTGNEDDFSVAEVDVDSVPLGLSRTFDLWLIPGTDADAVAEMSMALAARDDQWFSSSEAVLSTGVLGPIRMEAIDPESPYLQGVRANLHFLRASRERWKWYGFVNYGDVRTNFAYGRSVERGLHPGRWAMSGRYGWRNGSGDVPSGLLMTGLALNDRELAMMGLDYVRHITDVDMAHPPLHGPGNKHSGGLHRRNRDHWSGSVQMQYSPSNGLYLGYWLSGSPRLAQSLSALRDFALRDRESHSAFAAQAWVNHYRETQNVEDLEVAERLLDETAQWWERASGGKLKGRSALYAGNFRWASDGVSTIRDFYEATGDPEYLELMREILSRELNGEHGKLYYTLAPEGIMGYLFGAGVSESFLDPVRLQQSRDFMKAIVPENLPPQEDWSYDNLVTVITEILPGAPAPAYRESNAIGKRAANSLFALNLIKKDKCDDRQN